MFEKEEYKDEIDEILEPAKEIVMMPQGDHN